jgi:general L-amino acid transport system permease protein
MAEEHIPHPDLPPPITNIGVIGWMRQNLFSSPFNSALTLLMAWLLYITIPDLVSWALINASWSGDNREVCDANPEGACWTFINVRLNQILFGLYYGQNPDQVWRPITAFASLVLLIIPLLFAGFRHKAWLGGGIILLFPFFGFALIHGEWLGLPVAESSEWGGLMLTFILASIGIVAALPIGILLALGRRSEMPLVRAFSVIYIEFWRGTPLITILFMASVMLPLFFPSEVEFDKVVRALIGITLFQSAYTAEAIRGGLQAIPKGQYEAADALGLGYWRKMIFVILPQALRISIPGIVNTFIELFKDTSLVSIIGLLDLLNMAQTASRSLEWKGYDLEAYLFAAMLFWFFCYAISRYSQVLEKRLKTSH